jgi:hypothetical protein
MGEQLTENEDGTISNRAGQGEMRARMLVELFKGNACLKQLATDPNNSKLQKNITILITLG